MTIGCGVPERRVNSVTDAGQLRSDFPKHGAQRVLAVRSLQAVGVVGGQCRHAIGGQ